ncbi:hypothetical protein [Methanobrevibacter sp.]|uniref:hypothetical protein n=1 Tax=Methanobrevibacter sp. TaxID=66852 RepID=UPI0025D6BDA4|nr:hypothetical protein [Methanobrevibacter sp.]MBR4447081.1 hypothetical protein [Methanobrevibacter sp.]
MKGSVKANLIVFFIIAIIAFCISSAFATLTIHEDNDSYKLIPIENDSFEPQEIYYVPTVIPQNDTNTTNTTDSTFSNITNDIEDTIDNWTNSIDEIDFN